MDWSDSWQGLVVGCCERGNEPSPSLRREGIARVAKNLVALQESTLLHPLTYLAALHCVRSRVQKFPVWQTKAAPNGKCCEGYIVPSMVGLMYQLKSVLKYRETMSKNSKFFYFCHLKKLVWPETFGPYYVCYRPNLTISIWINTGTIDLHTNSSTRFHFLSVWLVLSSIILWSALCVILIYSFTSPDKFSCLPGLVQEQDLSVVT